MASSRTREWTPCWALALLMVTACASSANYEEREARQERTDPSAIFEGESVVQVRLGEFVIDMPRSIPAGPTVFQISNADDIPHSFEIEGQGIERSLDDELLAGGTATLAVELGPGTYHVYCPVMDHEDRGMSLQLEVE